MFSRPGSERGDSSTLGQLRCPSRVTRQSKSGPHAMRVHFTVSPKQPQVQHQHQHQHQHKRTGDAFWDEKQSFSAQPGRRQFLPQTEKQKSAARDRGCAPAPAPPPPPPTRPHQRQHAEEFPLPAQVPNAEGNLSVSEGDRLLHEVYAWTRRGTAKQAQNSISCTYRQQHAKGSETHRDPGEQAF